MYVPAISWMKNSIYGLDIKFITGNNLEKAQD